jgi:hypothetical protein
VLEPVSVSGYDGDALAESLSRESDYGAAEFRERKDNRLCRIELDPGSGYGASYSLRAGDDGCWTAQAIAPRSLDPESGCVNLFDLVGLSSLG